MGQIIVRLEKFAVESTVQEILAAAAAASGSSANAAEVVRDASGRVVQVNVNLPQSTAPGLATAAAKMSENSGVAQVAATTRVEDYASALDALVPGTTVTSITNGAIVMSLTGGAGSFKAAAALDSVGGVGSALLTQFSFMLSAQRGSVSLRPTIQASEFGLSAVKEYEVEFKLRKKGAWDSVASITLNTNMGIDSPLARIYIKSDGTMDVGFSNIAPTFSNAISDTYQTIKLGYKGGRLYASVNGVLQQNDISAFGEFPSSRIELDVLSNGNNSAAADILMDDLKVTLFSGVM